MLSFLRPLLLGSLSVLLPGAAPDSRPAPDDRVFAKLMNRAQMQVQQAEIERDKSASDVARVRDKLRELTGRADVSPDGIRRALTRLQEQQEQLQLEQAGAEGRKKGLMEAIDKMTVQLQKKAQADSAAGEMDQVLALREQELKRTQELAKQNVVSREQLDEAQVRVADARLKLIEVRRQAIGTTNAETLDTWNRELMNLSIGELERDGRLRFVLARLEHLSAALPLLDEMDRRMAEVRRAEGMLKDAERRLSQAEVSRPF
jgi:hypothetical protein